MMSGIFLLVATLGLVSGTEAALSLDLYYESLCPDSTRFISQQIGPMHAALGQDVTINFVPYGFATVTREFIDSVRDPTSLLRRPLAQTRVTSLSVSTGLMSVTVTWCRPAPSPTPRTTTPP